MGTNEKAREFCRKDYRGKPLHANEIWKHMQEIGVVSNSENPTGRIDRMARGLPKAEKVAGRTWRWKVEQPTLLSETTAIPKNFSQKNAKDVIMTYG